MAVYTKISKKDIAHINKKFEVEKKNMIKKNPNILFLNLK